MGEFSNYCHLYAIFFVSTAHGKYYQSGDGSAGRRAGSAALCSCTVRSAVLMVDGDRAPGELWCGWDTIAPSGVSASDPLPAWQP